MGRQPGDILGDKKTRGGRLITFEEMSMVFPHLRRSPAVGSFNPGSARQWLTSKLPSPAWYTGICCYSDLEGLRVLVVIEWMAELSWDTDLSLRL